jgi:mannosyltransferase
MTGNAENRLRWGLMVAIVLLAIGLRIYRLGAESLWYDETVSAYLASESLPAMVAHTAGDIHPPGYYLLLHAWIGLTGSSDWGMAFLSLFFGVLLVVLVYPLGAQVFGEGAGLLASLLVAISPYNIWYSQEVRMYTLGAALGLGLLAAVIPLLANPDARGFALWGRLALYAACGALGLWTLYYFAFLLVAVNLMVGGWWLVGRWRRRVDWGWLGRWVLAQGAVLLLYAPWFPVAWRQATEPPVPPWRGFTALGDLLVEGWSALSLGQSARPALVWPVLLLFALLFGLGLFSKRLRPRLGGGLRGGEGLPWLLAGYVFLPVLLVYLASFVAPLYHVRYLFTYSTPFYILVGAGLAWLWGRWRPAMWLSLAILIVFSGLSLYAYHFNPQYASDDHRAAVHFLAERWRPGDAVLINAGYAYPALLTYWDGDPIAWRGRLVSDEASDWANAAGQGPVVVQSGTVDGEPSLGWGDLNSDFYAMSQAETEKALERLFTTFDRVWVYRIYDTVTDPQGLIRRWLEEHGTPFEDQVFSGESQLRVQGFLTGRDPQAGETQPHDASLADGWLQLVGGTSLPPTVEVGGALDLALDWQVSEAQGDTTAPGKDDLLFAGLFDESGRRWAQTDERPLGSLYPAVNWPKGAVVRTPLRIVVPPGTPPGRYRLEVGWYHFVDGQPVWRPWTSGDRLVLGEVEVVAPEDWDALPLPEVAQPVHLTVGEGVRLLGFDAPSLEGYPGETLDLDLFWQALEDGPEGGPAVLQLQDDAGQVLAEWSSAPVGGRVPFAQLMAGQAIRDPRPFTLPGDLAPGVYNLVVGRQRPDGTWLPVRRSPFSLGTTYPLATLRVLGRPLGLTPPAVHQSEDAHFGEGIRFIGYDQGQGQGQALVVLTLHWQAFAPMDTRYKIFLHLVDEGNPSSLYAQTDVYPHLPTTAWVPGEYLSDQVTLELPPDLPPGRYMLLLGWYDEATGQRLPAYDAAGTALGDSLALGPFELGE